MAIEARKWAWALGELGYHVRRVAGAIEDGGHPTTSCFPASRSMPPGAGPPRSGRRRRDRGRARRRRPRRRREPLLAAAQHRCRAARSRARPREHPGRVVFRHHDLPWQRRHLAHLGTELPPRVDGALHTTINLRSRRELEPRLHRRRDRAQLLRSRPTSRRPRTDRVSIRLHSRRVRRVATLARDRTQERARRGAFRVVSRPPQSRPTGSSVGRGPGGGRLRRHAGADRRALGRTRDLGRAAQVADAYAACDVVVFPSTIRASVSPLVSSAGPATHRANRSVGIAGAPGMTRNALRRARSCVRSHARGCNTTSSWSEPEIHAHVHVGSPGSRSR